MRETGDADGGATRRPDRIGRRAFIRSAAVVVGAGVAGVDRATLVSAAGAPPSAHDASTRRIAALGRAYLRLRPGEANKAVLLRMLPAVDTSRPVIGQFPALQPVLVDDFASGRVVAVDGWVLALSEARAAAAIALGA